MSEENFDKEIALLYQQRKQEIASPKINLSLIKPTTKRRYSALQILSILCFGGVASFGILAVISHLSVQKTIKPESIGLIPVTVVELKALPESADDAVIIVNESLAPKKPARVPPKFTQQQVLKTPTLKTNLVAALPIDVVIIMPSTSIDQPTLSLVPIYQVLPKYSLKAGSTDQEGLVRLSFAITPEGKVYGITVDESHVNRALERAAKKALSKWRYQPDEYEQERYEIIFDFMLNDK